MSRDVDDTLPLLLILLSFHRICLVVKSSLQRLCAAGSEKVTGAIDLATFGATSGWSELEVRSKRGSKE